MTMNAITRYYIIVLLLVQSFCAKSQELPDYVRIYYWHNSDPWGWISDHSICATEIIKSFPDYIEINDSSSIRMLIPDITESKVYSTDSSECCFLSDWSDSRFVILLTDPAKTDTISMTSVNHFPIRYNKEFCFRDKDYYDFVVRTIMEKDKRFGPWYKEHYYDGSFHFFGKE